MKRKGVAKITVGVPTASEDSIDRLLPDVDEIYCLNIRTFFPFAVAEAYEDWYDLTDSEVISLLQETCKD
jgi:predicted phosphoribosyltransferase